MRPSPLRIGVLVAANVLGLFAFVWPFVLPLGGDATHEIDAPVILADCWCCSAPCCSSSWDAAAWGRRPSR